MAQFDHYQSVLDKRKKYLYPTKVALYETPLLLVKAKGNSVWDHEGKEYLDFFGGIVTISVGHNHPRIIKQLKNLLDEDHIQHTSNIYLNQYMEELAAQLSQKFPDPKNIEINQEDAKCYFTNSGSEANEVAMLTARVSTGEQVIIALRHGYHGGTTGPLQMCGHHTWKFNAQPNGGVVHAKAPYCYRCPYGANPGKCSLECANDVKEVIETCTNGKVAGIFVEPVMGVGGFITPPIEYHQKVSQIMKEFGGLYISDEVQTALGRTGKSFFAIEESNVTPDIITMAKGLGNGAPIGAVVTKAKHANSLKGKLHFNTFGGDPFQCKQASEVVKIVEDENLIQNAHKQGEFLKNALLEMQQNFSFIGDVRGRGLMIGVELVTDPKKKTPAPTLAMRILEECKKDGLLIGKGGLYANVIRMAPSLNISTSECEKAILTLKKAFQTVKQA